MTHSRRDALTLGIAASAALPAAALAGDRPASRDPVRWRAGRDGQRRADLGDGRYRNPVLAGDRPDPNILKDGADYWATFSSFEYYPAVVVWHSQDLVNWTPVGPALT